MLFSKCVPLVKLKLLRSYCSDFCDCVLWDLSDNAVDNVCVAWRKGLRRTLDLPACILIHVLLLQSVACYL